MGYRFQNLNFLIFNEIQPALTTVKSLHNNILALKTNLINIVFGLNPFKNTQLQTVQFVQSVFSKVLLFFIRSLGFVQSLMTDNTL